MTARLYLRPTGYVDAPFGHDGQVLRLAGGLIWFSAIELIAVENGQRVRQELVPVERIDAELDEAGHAILARITAPRPPIKLAHRTVPLDQPQVMAILNVTPDSFSDGGQHVGDPAGAAEAGMRMLEAGAAILDVGGESTRPGAATVWEGDEIARVVPTIERLAAAGAAVSIDTRKAAVMEAALDAGAAIVNDVSALTYDERAMQVVAERGCPIVLMHHRPKPDTRTDVLIQVYDWLEARIEAAVAAGVDRANIIVDPGLGAGSFGKSVRDNLALINGLSLLHGLGCPILLGASRKTFIGALNGEAPVEKRLGGSIATALAGAAQGVQLLRVHDAFETVQATRIWRGLRDEALSPV
ncbi:dihydropteroate synthase [Sphingomonas sp. MMS24-J13]|uniref:dihydropteroate synthase n=1 Tax=Sphingomonas sp. MMS24-J13 TaxID=3238686 RepID=UPI00384A64C7